MDVGGANPGTLVVLDRLAINGQPRFMVGDDWQTDLLGLLGVPGKLQSTMGKNSVAVAPGRTDNLVLVGIGTDIGPVEVLLRDWEVIRGPLFNL